MQIVRSVDIETVVRDALADHLTAYVRPLPKEYALPCVLVTKVGGSDRDLVDTLEVVLDSRGANAADADETLRNAIGILKAVAKAQTTAIRGITVNSSGSWGQDPVRPDLAMCSARLRVVAHLEKVNL